MGMMGDLGTVRRWLDPAFPNPAPVLQQAGLSAATQWPLSVQQWFVYRCQDRLTGADALGPALRLWQDMDCFVRTLADHQWPPAAQAAFLVGVLETTPSLEGKKPRRRLGLRSDGVSDGYAKFLTYAVVDSGHPACCLNVSPMGPKGTRAAILGLQSLLRVDRRLHFRPATEETLDYRRVGFSHYHIEWVASLVRDGFDLQEILRWLRHLNRKGFPYLWCQQLLCLLNRHWVPSIGAPFQRVLDASDLMARTKIAPERRYGLLCSALCGRGAPTNLFRLMTFTRHLSEGGQTFERMMTYLDLLRLCWNLTGSPSGPYRDFVSETDIWWLYVMFSTLPNRSPIEEDFTSNQRLIEQRWERLRDCSQRGDDRSGWTLRAAAALAGIVSEIDEVFDVLGLLFPLVAEETMKRITVDGEEITDDILAQTVEQLCWSGFSIPQIKDLLGLIRGRCGIETLKMLYAILPFLTVTYERRWPSSLQEKVLRAVLVKFGERAQGKLKGLWQIIADDRTTDKHTPLAGQLEVFRRPLTSLGLSHLELSDCLR